MNGPQITAENHVLDSKFISSGLGLWSSAFEGKTMRKRCFFRCFLGCLVARMYTVGDSTKICEACAMHLRCHNHPAPRHRKEACISMCAVLTHFPSRTDWKKIHALNVRVEGSHCYRRVHERGRWCLSCTDICTALAAARIPPARMLGNISAEAFQAGASAAALSVRHGSSAASS